MKSISSKRAKALAISTETRRAVYHRDGGLCVYCGGIGNPEAHYIPRSKGGLGCEKNVLTLCRACHDKFDHGTRMIREGMREYFAEYLASKYPDWNEDDLIYRKENL